jgi:DNA-directed RNA polymerase subunit alpha
VDIDDSVSTEVYGRFIIEPFERGFGTTIGNSLRRVLLSTLEGAAVTTVKFGQATHEFTSIPGVLEDVTDIILNVKSLVVSCDSDDMKSMRVSRSSPGEVRAGDIEADPAIEVINKDQIICTLTDNVPFDLEMTVQRGRGYTSADDNRSKDQVLGVIPIDSVYSPVLRVRYKTEDTRVGQRTNYDRLILEVWTRGTISPEDALVEAAKILRKHLNPFVMHQQLGYDVVIESAAAEPLPATAGDSELGRLWNQPVSVLKLSVRASNCLESARINTLGELASKTEADLLRVRSFGKTSLREVRRKLAEHGLALGMTRGSASGPSSGGSSEMGFPSDELSVPVEVDNS